MTKHPINFQQMIAKTTSHFEHMSKSTIEIVGLIGTTAVGMMSAMEGYNISMSSRMSDLEQRLLAVEKKRRP